MKYKTKHKQSILGFTLIEVVIGIGIFVILAVAVLGAYSALVKASRSSRMKTITSALASRELEVVRNLPYSEVGTVAGNPVGVLPNEASPRQTTVEGVDFSFYFEVVYEDDEADGTFLSATDDEPNDYKLVKLVVKNEVTAVVSLFETIVAPQGAEGLVDAGGLRVYVFNATGQPLEDVTVTITNSLVNPVVNLSRTTDSAGMVVETDLPESVNGYHIVATKEGYTTDQTYPITAQNPNPINPDATVVNGRFTYVSLQIDLPSTLILKTLNDTCQGVDGVDVEVKGSKLLGTNPNVLKYDQTHVSNAGLITLNNMEWDTYFPTLAVGEPFVVRGTSPVQEITVLPNTTHTFTMIIDGPGTGYSLLVLVKDGATGAAIEGADIHLIKGGSNPQEYEGTTGGSVWLQGDWTEGSGQANWIAKDKYFQDDGNIDINSIPTGLRLKKVTGRYVASGSLESSSFDTGLETSDYTSLVWEPTSQDPNTVLKFQIATNNDNATWDFLGPDGTSNTYYEVSGTTINSVHDNNRYVRYRAFLSTSDNKKTPILTSLMVNYVSGCYTPGQLFFPNLTQGQNYDITVTAPGYQTFQQLNMNVEGDEIFEVILTP